MSAPNPKRFLGVNKVVKSKRKIKRKCPPSLFSFDSELSNGRANKSERLTGRDCVSAKSRALIKAETLQSKLDPKHPSFIKPLLKSHVTGGFWLGLPVPFCHKYLPDEDTFMTLLCQNNGNQYQAKYLPRKSGLSGGWKGCAVSERFLVGDVFVFYLVSVTRFKVFVIRQNNLTEIDGALNLLNLDTQEEQSGSDMSLDSVQHGGEMNHFLHGATRRNLQLHNSSETDISEVNSRNAPSLQTGNEVILSCHNFTSFENFSISIDELLIDFELPDDVKRIYYDLCCNRKALLHAHLLEDTNHILIAGAIIETVSIARALKNCQMSTSSNVFAKWDKTLSCLELLGMNVGFLRTHLLCVQRLACNPEIVKHRQKYTHLCSENVLAVDEIKRLQATKLTRVSRTREAEIKTLRSKVENHELEFREQVRAPW